MPTRVKISFPQDEKTITVGKGWDRELIQKFIEMELGTSIEEEIVGKKQILPPLYPIIYHFAMLG